MANEAAHAAYVQSARAVGKLTLNRLHSLFVFFFFAALPKSHFMELQPNPFTTSCVCRQPGNSSVQKEINARHVFALYTLVSLVIALVVVSASVSVVVVAVCLWGTMSMASAELWHPGA